MHGAIPPLSATSSWRSVRLKASSGTSLPLPYHTALCEHVNEY